MSGLALPARRALELPRTGRRSSDERLAALVTRGDERAFATLYERHHQALYRYCRAIVRNEHDAEDALQSAMMHALAALRANERDLAVRPWLFRIAHNEAVTILRKRAVAPAPAEDLETAGAHADGLDVEGAVAQRERLAALVADLQALGERQRSALVMRELSGLSVVEIASALSTSAGAAKQLLYEARSAMHELAQGRAMDCEVARRAISDGDRRVWRGRRVSAHLRSCAGCREFQAAIASRRADLRALAPPLPALAASALLAKLLARATPGSHTGALASGGAAASATSAGAAAGAHTGIALVAKVLVAAMLAAGAAVGATHLAGGAHRSAHAPHAHAPATGGVRHASSAPRARAHGVGGVARRVTVPAGASRPGGRPAPTGRRASGGRARAGSASGASSQSSPSTTATRQGGGPAASAPLPQQARGHGRGAPASSGGAHRAYPQRGNPGRGSSGHRRAATQPAGPARHVAPAASERGTPPGAREQNAGPSGREAAGRASAGRGSE